MTARNEAEVDAFLQETTFSGYQRMPLPFGREVEGIDRTPIADIAFKYGVEGKSVLDIGTYYGYLPYAAMRRGASRAVGVEMDGGRHAIANRIAELHGTYSVEHAALEDFEAEERFDVVLFLNVMHHVIDPVAALQKVASLCGELMIVEFTRADDWQYLENVISGGAHVGPIDKVRARARSLAIRAAAGRMPLVAVGDRQYHRTWYFSPAALRNLLVVHLQVATEVEFVASPHPGRRAVALCRMKG